MIEKKRNIGEVWPACCSVCVIFVFTLIPDRGYCRDWKR